MVVQWLTCTGPWAVVVVVKWSACMLSTPTIWVQILLKPTQSFFCENLCWKRTKINEKQAGVGTFFKKKTCTVPSTLIIELQFPLNNATIEIVISIVGRQKRILISKFSFVSEKEEKKLLSSHLCDKFPTLFFVVRILPTRQPGINPINVLT